MTRATAMLAVLVLVVAACGSGGTVTAPPPPTPSPEPTPPPSGSIAPTATPSSTGCAAFEDTSGPWPSNRLVGMRVDAVGAEDVLTFTFDEPAPWPVPATAGVRAADPPFSMAGSGAPVEVAGSEFYEFRFDGMQIADESGTAVYRGERNVVTGLPWIAQVVLLDESEGVVTFVVGTTGGCPWLESEPAARVIRFHAGGAVP